MKGPGLSSRSEVPAKWRKHYKVLLDLLHRLQMEHGDREVALRLGEEKGGNDVVDHANFVNDAQQSLDRFASEAHQLSEIEAALRRIEDGSFGICELTGEPIEPARLTSLPWTRLSGSAARQREDLKR